MNIFILFIIIFIIYLFMKFKKIKKNKKKPVTVEYLYWKKLYYKAYTLNCIKKNINKLKK